MTGPQASAPRDSAAAPAKCPSCGSRDLVTTSKTIDASTYWRCAACGEVWNVARQHEASRYVSRRPFGR
jgi:transposase-like protein